MALRPLGARLIVKPKAIEEKTAGGIYLPQSAGRQQTQYGEVVAVGDGVMPMVNGALPVHIGDTVMFDAYSGVVVKDGLDSVTLLSIDAILAIVEI
jgi:chaperonin GroES